MNRIAISIIIAAGLAALAVALTPLVARAAEPITGTLTRDWPRFSGGHYAR